MLTRIIRPMTARVFVALVTTLVPIAGRSASAQSPRPCVATDHRIVRAGAMGDTLGTAASPSLWVVSEPCDASPKGNFIAPAAILDWTPTQAPPFKFVVTGYNPRASSGTFVADPTRAMWGVQATENSYDPNVLQRISSPEQFDLSIGANEGRLRSDLRDAARRADPNESLCRSAFAYLSHQTAVGNALADLSVTGRRAYAAFKTRPPQEAAIRACLQKLPSLIGTTVVTDAMRAAAADSALDRAYRVLHVIRAGGWPSACPERDALGYIAVSGEDDQPHRPVDVPTAEFPNYDLEVSVPRANGKAPLVVHTRYMIAHTFVPAGAELATCAGGGRKIPADRKPVLAPDAEVLLYIHGMDGSLEEALTLTRALHELGREQHRNYTVISMDLPTSGYADNIEPDTIAPLSAYGHAPGRDVNLVDGLTYASNGYTAPILDFDENFVVAFVNTLSKTIPVAQHVRAVVGGSLGGNLTMRLGRPRADAPWITHVVPWSPAAIWPSFVDDPVKHAALAVTWYLAGGEPSFAEETPGARRSFFYGNFDWQTKVFGLIPVGGGRPQSEYWARDAWPCKHAGVRLARISRYETYNRSFRLWHWRLGLEQLQYSHRSPKPGTAQPLYLSNTKPMLLMCGVDDVGGDLCKSTQEVAPLMVNTPGYALFLLATGHSIHDERPRFLARRILEFLATPTVGLKPLGSSGTVTVASQP